MLYFLFADHTSGPYIENITITETNMLSVKIVYERVYPRPNCSSVMHVRMLKIGTSYAYQIHIQRRNSTIVCDNIL